MVSNVEFEERLDVIADWLDSVDAEITREVEGTFGKSDRRIEGYAVQYGGSSVKVFGSPDTEYVSITYSFSPVGTIALSRLQSQAKVEGTDTSKLSKAELEEYRQTATADLRSHFDDEELGRIYHGLFELLGADAYAIDVRMEDRIIREAQVSKKLFTADDRVGLQRFADTMQAVASKGALGNAYLRRAYELDSFVEVPRAGEDGLVSDELDEDPS